LGHVGRNFAAGMSGGAGYVLDWGDGLSHHLNRASVRCHRVDRDEHVAELRSLIRRHVAFTMSPRATTILNTWDATLPHFWRVIPHDFS